MSNKLPTQYQEYIHLSRYARWLPDKRRRETWDETVARYFDFFENHLQENHNYQVPQALRRELEEAVLGLEVLPSMRCLMTAGKALEKESIAGYNCSYIAVDDPRAFDEALYILMNGTGLGFSVERQYISKLPEVPEELHDTDTTIVVADSKLGWAKALKELVSLLYNGLIPKWDLSRLRPAGAPLKTFGGRASGPAPLDSLLNFAVSTFKAARGRKLTSIECHDIMCKIGEVVVVGGVRRSAMISLSNLSDDRMRAAKSGQWWERNSQRALANNSAVYTEKPDTGIFMAEWLSLYESKSGERGIFNRQASKKKVATIGRRDPNHEFGTNPSLRAGTKVWTTDGVVPIEHLEGKTFTVRNLNGNLSKAICWLSGKNKQLYKITLEGGHIYYATPEHEWPVWQNNSWVKVSTDKLAKGYRFPTIKNDYVSNGNLGDYDDGFIVGWNLGDGWITERSDNSNKQIGFIVEDSDREHNIHLKIQKYLQDKCKWTGSFEDKKEINVNNENLRKIFNTFKVQPKKEGLPLTVWNEASEQFRRGLIDGLFSSDGCCSISDGRITLTTSNENLARDVSDLLGFYGIKNNINYTQSSNIKFPNGKTYDKIYHRYQIRIGNKTAIKHFSSLFTLSNKKKQANIDYLVSSVKQHRTTILDSTIRIISVELSDIEEDVWDISVYDDTHCFQIAHCITGNCSEIILRNNQFCNLSEIVVRETDTYETLARKARLATILGTWQSTLTNFKYLRKRWKDNTEEERLLGVSMTGIFDNPIMNTRSQDFDRLGFKGFNSLEEILNSLRDICVAANLELATTLNIPQSTAITCVKPSGTVSQLVNSASGIHARHSPYYVRTVRADKKDPLAQFMIDQGFPVEDDVMNPNNVYVFSFPVKSSPTAIYRDSISAVNHLSIWLTYQRHWCEHKPSVTITVKEDEWFEVAAWVYRYFDEMSGVSFLPHSDHVYKQAPYQDCNKETYEELLAKMPKNVSWLDLAKYESKDHTTGSQELACTAGGCEI